MLGDNTLAFNFIQALFNDDKNSASATLKIAIAVSISNFLSK